MPLTSSMSNMTTSNFSQYLANSEKLFVKRFTAYYVIVTIEALLGIGGNGLFLLSLFKIKNATSNMYVTMSSLAVADFLSSIRYSSEVIRDLLIKSNTVQYELCRVQFLISSSWLSVNTLHLLLMSVDRYLCVAAPHR